MNEGMENRRREVRCPVSTVVTINEQLAMVKDISPCGMRVTALSLKPQQLIELTMKSVEGDIPMKALVRWVRRTFPFESYSECGLALISAPGAYHKLCDDIIVPPRLLPAVDLWPVSLVLLSLAVALIFWL